MAIICYKLVRQLFVWDQHLKAYNRVAWLASSKDAADQRNEMQYWLDLAEEENALVWLTIRDTVYELRQKTDEATFLLGPILVVDIALIITIIIRVYVGGITFDNLNILASYDVFLFTTFLVAFIPKGIQINQVLTEDHLDVIRKRREKLLRQYSDLETGYHDAADVDDNDRNTKDDSLKKQNKTAVTEKGKEKRSEEINHSKELPKEDVEKKKKKTRIKMLPQRNRHRYKITSHRMLQVVKSKN